MLTEGENHILYRPYRTYGGFFASSNDIFLRKIPLTKHPQGNFWTENSRFLSKNLVFPPVPEEISHQQKNK